MRATYAVQLSETNIDSIVEFGAQHHLNLQDFRDDMLFNADNGEETYAVASIDLEAEKLITITTMTETGFATAWILHPSDKYAHFVRATRR